MGRFIITEDEKKHIKGLYEQGPITPMLSNANTPRPSINLSKTQNFSGRPPKSEVEGGDIGCMNTFMEQVKIFMTEAKFWKGSVDETYMNKIIKKMIDGYKHVGPQWWFSNPSDVLNTFGKIKTKAGMGYLLRNFKYNGKNLFQTFETDHRFPWSTVAKILLDNGFKLERYRVGCRREDGTTYN